MSHWSLLLRLYGLYLSTRTSPELWPGPCTGAGDDIAGGWTQDGSWGTNLELFCSSAVKQVTHLFFRLVCTVPELMKSSGVGGEGLAVVTTIRWEDLGLEGTGSRPAVRPITHLLLELMWLTPKQRTSAKIWVDAESSRAAVSSVWSGLYDGVCWIWGLPKHLSVTVILWKNRFTFARLILPFQFPVH